MGGACNGVPEQQRDTGYRCSSNATAASDYANANTYNYQAIDQKAHTYSGGDANVSYANTGTLNVDAVAIAKGADASATATNYSAMAIRLSQ